MHKTYHIDAEPAIARRYSLLIYLMLALAFAVVTRPSIHGNDGVQNYAYLHSLMFDGDLDFSNEYEYFISRQADWFDRKQIPRDPVTNLPINLYGVGSSILWTPWVFLAHGAGKLMNASGADIQLNGYSMIYAVGVSFGSCFYASFALGLLFHRFKKYGGYFAASWSVLLIWLASPLFFYMYLHPSMSHANSFFLATLMLLQYLEIPAKTWRWALLGLTCGLMTITRFQDGILMISLLVGELWLCRESPETSLKWIKKRIPLYGIWTVGFLIALIPQILAWGILQGSFFSGPRAYINQGNFSFLSPVYAPQALFSSKHGLLYWHPGMILGVAGLLIAGVYMREKMMGLTAFAAQCWVIGSWSIWWAGASFGHRMFISTLPFIAFGALFVTGRPGKIGLVIRLLILFLIFWNFGLVVQYGFGWISRQEGVSLAEMAYNNFVRIPQFLLRMQVTPWEALNAY